MRTALCVVLVASLLPFGAFAASNPREFNRLVKQAERLYEAGKYQEAAERLIEAYVYQPHPRLIYNIARAYDQAGELTLSLEYYQRYLSSKEGADPMLLKRSALSIDRIRGLMRQREQASEEKERLSEQATLAQKRAAEEAEAKRRAEEALRQREVAAAEARKKARSRNRILAFGLGGVALAGLGTGTVFGLQANGSKAQFTGAQTVDDKLAFQKQTQGQALVADIGFGAGVVAALAAVLLYPKGPEPETETSVTFVPRAGGAGLEVSF